MVERRAEADRRRLGLADLTVARTAAKPKGKAPARRRPPRAKTQPAREAVIKTRDLTKVYGGHLRAVDQLNLEVFGGEIFGLLGPNGAGKTTTVGMLTTRVIPTSGDASVAGIDVRTHPALAKQTMGVVPQENTLDRSLTVYENLYFHGRYFGMAPGEAKRRANIVLGQFRLDDRASSEVAALSGGMAQRLMVARSVMHRPKILFLDEPTAGLDPQSRLALWEILGELHERGQTILLTTHYMEEADQLCDRVAIMDHGKILALDEPAELKRSAGADTVVVINTDGNPDDLAKHMQTMRGATHAVVVDSTVHVSMRRVDGVVPKVIAHAERKKFHVTDLSVTEPTLETVFIRLTGKDLRE
jgi:ABC-2 type transport system ATP-binding protein